MTPWPILSPSRDDGHACPDWCRLTSARCRGPRPQGEAADPETNARREEEALARRAARREALETRQREREAAAEARKVAAAREREETRRLRAELSKRRQAERAKRAEPLAPEERSRRIREGLARAQATGRMPKAKPKPPEPVVPEGFVRISLAAEAVGRSKPCLDRAVRRGRLASVLIKDRLYVSLEGAREYVAWATAERKGAAAKARAAYSAKAAAQRAERPWAKLCPKNRGRPRKGAA